MRMNTGCNIFVRICRMAYFQLDRHGVGMLCRRDELSALERQAAVKPVKRNVRDGSKRFYIRHKDG